MQSIRFGIACAFGAAFFYGLVPNLFRAAFNAGVPAVESGLVRTLLMVAVAGAIAIGRRDSFVLRGAAWPWLVAQAAATAIITLCYGASVQFIPVGLAVVIFFTCPLIVLVAAPRIEGARVGAARMATALLGFAGLVVALGLGLGDADWRGVALAFTAACGYAAQFFSGRALAAHLRPAAIACLAHVLVLPVALIGALAGGGGLRLLSGAVGASGWSVALGVALAYIAGYLLQITGLRAAPASRLAPIFNIEPVVAISAAALAFGERLTPHQYAGGALVLTAALIATRLGGREAGREE